MTDNMGEKALIWLGQEGFTMEPLKEPGFTSLFRAYKPSSPRNKISLSQADGGDKIVIAAGVFLADDDQAQMAKLPPNKRAQIIKELSKILYNNACVFRMEENQGVLEGITMTRLIFAEGFSKDRLMNAVFGLYGMQALVLLHLSDYLVPEVRRFQESPQAQRAAPVAEPVRENVVESRREAAPPQARATPYPAPSVPRVSTAPPAPSAPAAPPVATKAFCVNCGKEINPAEKFCHYCGAKRSV